MLSPQPSQLLHGHVNHQNKSLLYKLNVYLLSSAQSSTDYCIIFECIATHHTSFITGESGVVHRGCIVGGEVVAVKTVKGICH